LPPSRRWYVPCFAQRLLIHAALVTRRHNRRTRTSALR
jgi:hypothetical protein